ncbi:hypothetical protein [Clostridium botulinum]|uniref:Uncharacterized protein n=1 Tax=Clostridium botulinum TaxID=1491 RepID=A0A6B4NWV5_CLOBO|nr:hypothetical protein [Clostridium botulinum]APH21421.1 hypothetical protein NPD1_909 [Clostridium botulinum]APQ68386.1 hypothetical protein RSJ8_3121 [Clostridium botulinum]AXG96963.1 hypothetical protein AGE31_15525 [Clostridium botulinum]MBN3351069.1 hypothetical protein [Clostridium botulinum]MBN3360356.1 hypothetical protein [Clostridium botulinum]
MKLNSQRTSGQGVSRACWCTSCTGGCAHGCTSCISGCSHGALSFGRARDSIQMDVDSVK